MLLPYSPLLWKIRGFFCWIIWQKKPSRCLCAFYRGVGARTCDSFSVESFSTTFLLSSSCISRTCHKSVKSEKAGNSIFFSERASTVFPHLLNKKFLFLRVAILRYVMYCSIIRTSASPHEEQQHRPTSPFFARSLTSFV